jgi:hypothetical protein
MPKRFVRIEPTSSTRKSTSRRLTKSSYTGAEVEELVAKALRENGVDPDALTLGDVRRLDIDAARQERQAELEKSMREQVESRQVVLHDADHAAVFVGKDGRETGRMGEAPIAKGRVSFVDVVDQPATDPYTRRSMREQRSKR